MIASSSRAALLALALLFPAIARAEPPREPPTEAQIEAARALYREARELHKQGKLREAIDRALEAYRTAPTPVTALEAGTLLVEGGRLVEARDLLRTVALLPVSPRESDKGREARQHAAELARSLDARIPKIAIAERPQGAEVLLDGRPFAGDNNAWQGVDPGAHTIVVRIGERTCTKITTALGEGEERTIDLHAATKACLPDATPQPPPSAAPQPSAPPPPIAAPPPHAAPEQRRWIGAVVAGAGVVAIGFGGVIALVAKSDYDAVAASCSSRGCTRPAFDARESARSRADLATATMIVGAAAAAVGAVVFFWPSTNANVTVGANEVRVGVRF